MRRHVFMRAPAFFHGRRLETIAFRFRRLKWVT